MRGRKKAAKRPLPARKAPVSRNGRGPAAPSPADARLAEALAQQAATADILRIIATSRDDAQPVFDAIAESAARLCASYDAAIYRVEADRLVLVAHHGPIMLGRVGEFSLPIEGSVAGHAVRARRAVQVADAQAVGSRYPASSGHAPRMGFRTMLCVPLLLNGVAVGAFALRRTEVQRFTTRQIALLRSFADQAIIAIENARLFKETRDRNRDLTDSLERETATSEILRVISSSPNDLQPVFDIIARSAAVLCGAKVGAVTRFDGELVHMVAVYGSSRRGTDILRKAFPLPPGGKAVSSRAIRDRAVTHIPDVLTEPEYGIREAAVASGFRAALGVPMLRDGRALGAIVIGRSTAGPFSEREIDLLRTFADQAVIAIENARLFREVSDRNRDLTESLERETATGEILRVISSSPNDLQPVFDIIARSAAVLCGAESSTVARYDGELVHMVAIHGSSRRGVDALRAAFPRPPSGETASVRAIRDRAIVHIPDVLTDAEYGIQGAALASGFRAVLGVPMLRDGRALGAIALGRSKVGPFSEREIDLLRTFADQAVIAIENVRLFTELGARNRDLTDSLEQQTATGEILRVIASSPGHIEPTFDAIARAAARLCEAETAGVFRFDGEMLHFVAEHGRTPAELETTRRAFPQPAAHDTPAGRAVLTGAIVQIDDIHQDPALQPATHIYRTVLSVPLLRQGRPVGVISLARRHVRRFSDQQVALIQTFADQAVIAVENAHLFQELERKNRDLTETLEQQTATGEILRVISSSPTNVKPVFDAIAAAATTLCDAENSGVFLYDGSLIHFAAHHNWNPVHLEAVGKSFPRPPGTGSLTARAILTRAVAHSADISRDPEYQAGALVEAGFRAVLSVPMLRDGEPIGAINVTRRQPIPFSDAQIALLETFAAQAVIAIHNVRLFQELDSRNHDLTESLEQQTATGEILQVISGSPTDVQPVFDAVASSAARLCDAFDSAIFRRDGDRLLLVAHHGPILVGRVGEFSLPLVRGTAAGRTVLDGRTIHVADMQGETVEFPESADNAAHMGFRAILSVPLMREGLAIGTIQLRRTEARAFSGRQVALLQTFASQAVIAIENTRLFTELDARNRDLTETLDQQTATGEILRAISSSPQDVQPVFDSIAYAAKRLCEAEFAFVFRYDGELIHFVAQHGLSAEGLTALRDAWPSPPDHGTAAGRAIRDRAVVHIPDVQADTDYLHNQVAAIANFRSVVAIPMLRDGEPIGAITVNRPKAGAFPERLIELLKTFADQAVIAVENVRLFTELDARNRDLTETLDQQTATGEILRAISGSPTDVQPVFDAIARNARRLCSGEFCQVFRVEDGQLHNVGNDGQRAEGLAAIRAAFPRPVDQRTAAGRAVLAAAVSQIADVEAEPAYGTTGVAKTVGFRSLAAVPILREGVPIGAIAVGRAQTGRFPERQVELLKTFAEQAVIAIENVRLFTELEVRNRDLTDSLERQTATAEILRVISRSPTDVQPVFDIIGERARRLCDAEISVVSRFDGDLLHLVALHGVAPGGVEVVQDAFPMRRDAETVSARSVRHRDVVHVADVLADPVYQQKGAARAGGYRGCLAVPMMREGQVIGSIFVARPEPGLFSDIQIELLKTFADQAVIAVQNVRLFNELEVRNRDLTETLEQQTATGEILRVISSSPTDAQPVFDTIASSAGRLCDARCFVFRFDAEKLHFVAQHGVSPDQVEAIRSAWPRDATRGSAAGRAVLDRAAVHIPDVAEDRDYELGSVAQAGAWRATAAIPMLRDGVPIGAISILRSEPGPFSDRQIELLRTFADQAVIAIENVRLFKELESRNLDLTETLQQQAATGEILRVISSSPTDIQPVLDAVAENSARLCEAYDAQIYRVEGQTLQLVASFGSIPSSPTRAISRGWVTGRSVVDRRTTHVHDLATESDAEYGIAKETQRRAGHRTTLATPLLREGEPLGAILIRRMEIRPFSDKQIKLLETFADQAVIAIENVRLFKELEIRNRDLTETLEQQTATGEILRVISSSPTDVQPVLETIIRNAAQLCDGLFGAIGMLEDGLIHLRAPYNYTPESLVAAQTLFPLPADRSTLMGRSILDRAVAHLPNVENDPEYARLVANVGWRGGLSVPMLRDGVPIGAIFVARAQVGFFSDRQVELLRTFADQAVIAIENVRLFKELEVRNRDLTQTLEQQTATSEILRVISGSPTDVTPVFETIVERARHLCEADSATLLTYDGALVRMGAMNQTNAEQADALRDAYPMPATRGHATGRAILTGRPVHIPDVREDPEYTLAGLRDIVALRTLLSVPMIRAGQPIGCITMQRWGTPRPFSAKQMALVETFAEQAVIAIENTRLFKELDVRNRDLTVTLEQQTATSEILRVISSSPTDVQPVFDTIAESAVRLCDGQLAFVLSFDGSLMQFASCHGLTPEALAAFRATLPRPADDGTAAGRAIARRAVVQIPDVGTDHAYGVTAIAQAATYRSLLAVPILREGMPIGAITVGRRHTGHFPNRQVELLKTFADQAVIAIQNVHLFKELEVRNRDLTVTLEQQTATSEILRVISSSPTDVQPVFDTIAQNAQRLCDAEFCHIFRFEGGLLHFVGHHGLAPEGVEAIRRASPLPPGRSSAAARAVLSGQIEQIADIEADPDYGHVAIARLVTYRSIVAVPLMQEGRAIGAIVAGRSVTGLLPERQLELLKTFADQAVIAIQNVRLFQELDARTTDLTRSVGELKALGEVSQAVSSTLDLETVLATIVSRAVELSGCHSGIVYEYDEGTETFHTRGTHEISAEHLEALRAAPIHLGEGAIGTAAVIQKPVQVPDIDDERQLVAPQVRSQLRRQGLRSLLAMPLVREGRLFGGLVILRREVGQFAPEVLTTMQTFAAQSVLAIQNARLFVEVQRQRQYAGTLVETSPVAITTVDASGTVVGWNPAAVRLFGYTEAEAVGGQVEDLIGTPETREEIRGNVKRIVSGERLHAIGRRIRKDGSIVDVEMRSMPLIVDGAEMGFIATYHDITELLQARREAEAANEAKSAFLATMSHEIRTPMNAVIGMSGLLLNTSLSAEQREYAEIVRQSSDTLLTVINDILDFSKIEAGRLELETQPFELRECVEGALDLVATRAAEKGLDLAYLLGEGTPGAIVGDVTRLRQVLLNLLSNAVKFTERGEIVLSVTTRRPDGPGGLPELTFSVRDTGIGIPEDRIGRLFQSFSQVDASTTRRYGGTGLGLAISQRLTELMGGRITVTSEANVGSEFRFTLRCTPATVPVPTRRDLSGVQPSLRGKRVLVVDDNATNRRILASHLEVWGMLARVTESPLEALAWLGGGERFDLGILDMHMPEMDGVALAHAIRERTDHPAMPLILFTSLGRREARAEEEGFAAYLHKPIKPSQLFDALISVLGDQPVHVPQRGTVRTELDIEMATRHPLRILLAEDNVVNQKVATRLLGQMGYRADIAANGVEAVAAVERQTYDVVLMDVQMPDMDGFEASREINRRWPAKRPRIVAMTANAMEGDRELCVAAGMDDYVAKPIRVEELVAALGRCPAREDAAPRPVAVAAPTAPAADAVDRAVIDRLGESMGRDFAVELIDTFVADAQDLLSALRRALAASDRDGFRRAAHTLKSTGESLGAFALAALARELESIGQAGRLHEVGNRVDRLTDLYERVAHALGAIRRDLGA